MSEFVAVSGNQTIGGVKTFSQEVTMFGRDINLMSRLHYGKNSNPSDSCWHYVFFRGNTASEGYTNAWYSGFLEQLVNPDGSVRGRWVIRNTNENSTGIQLTQSADGSSSSLIPVFSSIDLGTSTNKWKTLNGINPGALSLPDYNNMLDVTSEVPIASLDGNTGINLNDYVPNITGWLSIVIANTTGNFIKATQGRAGTAVGYNDSRSYHSGAEDNEVISLFMPIIAGTWKSTWIKASSLIQMRFYYCLGNV